MIQITQKGFSSEGADISRLRSEFEHQHHFRLPKLLDPFLLGFIEARLRDCEWRDKVHPGITEEHVADDRVALQLLHFVANLATFRKFIQEATGCIALNRFFGRIYRLDPALGHSGKWHGDASQGRLIGMSINLSPRCYGGGLLLIRERGCEQVIAEISNTGFGDAVIFRISKSLEHRITDVEGHEPKTAFAGWFNEEYPDFFWEMRTHSESALPDET